MAGDFDARQAEVLEFWFPENGHWETREAHGAFWDARMQGGMDAEIVERFGPLTEAAADGALDHWAETPRGRLALIIALDQFPRSLWRDTPDAYAQDIKATRLAMEGLANGHYHALERPWERAFYIITMTHCEGPDHLERIATFPSLIEEMVPLMPAHLADMIDGFRGQAKKTQAVISRFGRHPHRNAVLGRRSTPAERDYIATGAFPHLPGSATLEALGEEG